MHSNWTNRTLRAELNKTLSKHEDQPLFLDDSGSLSTSPFVHPSHPCSPSGSFNDGPMHYLWMMFVPTEGGSSIVRGPRMVNKAWNIRPCNGPWLNSLNAWTRQMGVHPRCFDKFAYPAQRNDRQEILQHTTLVQSTTVGFTCCWRG